MAWGDINLQNMRVAAARFGGPIAMIRDDRQMVAVSGGMTQPVLRVYTAAGTLLSAFVWDKGPIVAMDWTDSEDLMVVQPDGQVHLFSMHGDRLPRQFSLGAECTRDGVLMCQTYSDGLIVLTTKLQLWAVAGLEEPRPNRLADPKLVAAPAAVAILEPRHSLSGCIEVLLAVDSNVMSVDADAAQQVATMSPPIRGLAVSPNGQFVATLQQDGHLQVCMADFQKRMSSFQGPAAEAAGLQVAWCGTDSVLLHGQDNLLMVGPYGDSLELPIQEGTVLVTECDSVRILSDEQHELLRRVPDAQVDVFRIGSTAPGAMLFDARQLFEQREAKADAALRAIASRLPEAVATCLDAAAADLDAPRQAALLKAACYGRAFCAADKCPRRRILEVCRNLRVLNALRSSDVGLPLTHTQVEALTMPVLVSRLVNARRHLLALRIAEMLGLGADVVLSHWACSKISAAADMADQQLHDVITARLKSYSGVRYSLVAAHAEGVGRRSLAAMLLENESCAADQVPLLVSLGESERALDKAALSGDTDLVYYVLFRMYKDQAKWPRAKFLDLLMTRPLARRLWVAYSARQLHADLRAYDKMGQAHLQTALRSVAALAEMGSSMRPGAQGSSAADLDRMQVMQTLTDAANQFNQSKEHAFQGRMCSEFARLRRVQADLEQETGHTCFLGRSVVQTVEQCIKLGNQRAANRVRQEFKLSERRWAWIKARALAGSQDWEALDAYSQERKLPIPLETFVTVAKAHNAPKPVLARLISRLPDASRKAEEYAAIGLLQEAAEAAAQVQDSAMLTRIQGMVGVGSPLSAAVTQLKDRITSAATR
eukprot:jgi/Astpho2/7024/e_gw1.00107.12.1_t